MSQTFQEATGFKPQRTCGGCDWIREMPRRHVCFKGGRIGRSVCVDEIADFCEGYEEASS
jgi:hypothetical protein